MADIFDIDFLRVLIEKDLGSDYRIASFYEQTKDQEQIDRYVDTYRMLVEEANGLDVYKGIGIVKTRGGADITNLSSKYINPFEFDFNIQTIIKNRDEVLIKLKSMINKLKGKRFQFLQDDAGNIIPINDIEFSSISSTKGVLSSNCYVGEVTSLNDMEYASVYTDIYVFNNYLCNTINTAMNIYFSYQGKLYKTPVIYNGSTYAWDETNHVLISNTFNKVKLDLAFEEIQRQEPTTLNGDDVVWFSLGGQATLCDSTVPLANDCTKTFLVVGSGQNEIVCEVEPIDNPSDISFDDLPTQTIPSGYKGRNQLVGMGIRRSFSLISNNYDLLSNELLYYALYGIYGSNYYNSYATMYQKVDNANKNEQYFKPNTIFTIYEVRTNFEIWNIIPFNAKVFDIEAQNTNSGIIQLNITFAIQG